MLSATELNSRRQHIVRTQNDRQQLPADTPGRICWAYETNSLEGCYSLVFTLEWFLTLSEPEQKQIDLAFFRAESLIVGTLDKLLLDDDPDLNSWQEVHLVGIWLLICLAHRHGRIVFVEPSYTVAMHFIPQTHRHHITTRFPGIAMQANGKLRALWVEED